MKYLLVWKAIYKCICRSTQRICSAACVNCLHLVEGKQL